jgi:hypothetical protein
VKLSRLGKSVRSIPLSIQQWQQFPCLRMKGVSFRWGVSFPGLSRDKPHQLKNSASNPSDEYYHQGLSCACSEPSDTHFHPGQHPSAHHDNDPGIQIADTRHCMRRITSLVPKLLMTEGRHAGVLQIGHLVPMPLRIVTQSRRRNEALQSRTRCGVWGRRPHANHLRLWRLQVVWGKLISSLLRRSGLVQLP